MPDLLVKQQQRISRYLRMLPLEKFVFLIKLFVNCRVGEDASTYWCHRTRCGKWTSRAVSGQIVSTCSVQFSCILTRMLHLLVADSLHQGGILRKCRRRQSRYTVSCTLALWLVSALDTKWISIEEWYNLIYFLFRINGAGEGAEIVKFNSQVTAEAFQVFHSSNSSFNGPSGERRTSAGNFTCILCRSGKNASGSC